MRTTIRLDDDLLRQAKAQAGASGLSLNDFIADAVRAALSPRRLEGRRLRLPTFRGRGLQPGVDLDDSAALLDLMHAGESDRYARAARDSRQLVAERARKPRG